MKKFLALALAICLVTSIFVGCSKKTEETTTAAATQSSTTKQETTQAQGKIAFDGKVSIEAKDGEKLEFDLPISIKDLSKFGTVEITDENYSLRAQTITNGGFLKWKDYDLELHVRNSQNEAIALKDAEVVGILVDISEDDTYNKNNQDLKICGFSFSMTPEELVAQCGEPKEIDKADEDIAKFAGYEYLYDNTEADFDFENDKLFSIYVGTHSYK